MYETSTNLGVLARRAGLGDHAAAAQLRNGLERQLPRLVRHALRNPDSNRVLGRQLGAEMRCFANGALDEDAKTRLVDAAARRVCDQVMRRVTSSLGAPVARETVRI